jgi:RecA-family ATPase
VRELAPQDQIPPHSLEMEQSVLGCMLIDEHGRSRALEAIQPEDFYRDAHRVVFEAISALVERDQSVDILTLQVQLQNQGVLDAIGGTPYLVQLMNAVAHTAHVEHYARVVAEKAIRRRIIDAASQILSIAYQEEDMESTDVIERCETALAGATEGATIAHDPLMIGEIGADQMPAVVNLPDLWFGIYPRKVHVLIGETGAGKSSLLYNVAIAAARNEKLWGVNFGLTRPLRVFYVDPENAGSYRPGKGDILDGGLCRRKIDRILHLEDGEVCPPTLRFHDGDGMNLSNPAHMKRLERRIKRGYQGEPFDLVILDPLLPLFGLENENDNAELGRVADACRMLSRRTGAAVLVAHHTGKSAIHRGVMSGRGGSALPGGMDVVFTWRARGPAEDETDEDYTGETRERSDVCRLRIEKDRPSQYGANVSLYLKMIGKDRFERVRFADWKEAAKSEDAAEAEGKAGQAAFFITDLLRTEPRRTTSEIIAALKAHHIGDKTTRLALNNMVKAGDLTMERIGVGGRGFYSLAGQTEEPRDTNHAQSAENEIQTSKLPNFQTSPTPSASPGKADATGAADAADAAESQPDFLTEFQKGLPSAGSAVDPFADDDEAPETGTL